MEQRGNAVLGIGHRVTEDGAVTQGSTIAGSHPLPALHGQDKGGSDASKAEGPWSPGGSGSHWPRGE